MHPKNDRRVDANLIALDEWLFNPAGWFFIDTKNGYVKNVVVPTLGAGLELVGRGRNAALVGRLREGAWAIDVDVKADFGHWVTAEVSGWLAQRGIWHLVRPSGGADGRHHIFCVPGANHEMLRSYLAALTEELNLGAHELDLRNAVRALSSPHRLGSMTRPKGDLREALRGLQRALPVEPARSPISRRRKVTARTPGQIEQEAAAGNVVPLFLEGRKGRPISRMWRRYLEDGVRPQLNNDDGKRSLPEYHCTLELVWAGHDAASAWSEIRRAHPNAMVKARIQGFSWWVKYVWNQAVEDAETFAPAPTASAPPASPEIAFLVAEARERLETLMWSQSPRSRASLLLVGHHLLDRVLRSGQLRVPCAERELVKDTGITDRKTVRAALRLMDGVLGRLHRDCLSLIERETTSYEFEIDSSALEGLREIPPRVSHPPHAVRGLWATLPRSSHAAWRALLSSDAPLTIEEVAQKAGMVAQKGDCATKSQIQTLKTALKALGQAGIARIEEDGRWYAGTAPRSVDIEQRAAAAYAGISDRVEAERTEYRAGVSKTWAGGRAIALKKQISRQKQWWDDLSPAARAERRAICRQEFQSLSITEQAERKSHLAQRRVRAGFNELEHHQSWLTSLSADEFLARSHERRAAFRRMSQSERGLAVTAWFEHRRRYGLPSPHSPTTRTSDEFELLPDGTTQRDEAFLQHQLKLDDASSPPTWAAG